MGGLSWWKWVRPCAGLAGHALDGQRAGRSGEGRSTTAWFCPPAPRLGRSAGRAATALKGPPPLAGTPSSVRLAAHAPPWRDSTGNAAARRRRGRRCTPCRRSRSSRAAMRPGRPASPACRARPARARPGSFQNRQHDIAPRVHAHGRAADIRHAQVGRLAPVHVRIAGVAGLHQPDQMIVATLPEIQLDAPLMVADRRQPARRLRRRHAPPVLPRGRLALGGRQLARVYSAPAEVAARIT